MHSDFEAVIGIETHVQLKTKSKIFCSDSTDFEASDNENASPVSAGMPGTLPVLNEKVLELAVTTGLALGCHIRPVSIFARKNYFYPDLPKGYQISQYDKPICESGAVEFRVGDELKKIKIERAHLEEDAGKSTHHGHYTLINLNRAGIPLLEIVSGPELRSSQEAAEYGRAIRQIVRYLGVCDGNLEEGSLRCDVNVSVRKKGESKLGTKVEIKNINSFRFIEKAVDYEIDRQINQIETGQKIIQETRLYDPDKNRTFSMRTKEDAQDYRYFPDPDLLPIILSKEKIEHIRASLPELPMPKFNRFVSQFGLSLGDALFLTSELEIAQYFEEAVQFSGQPKLCANWITTELMAKLNSHQKTILNSPVKPQALAELIQLIESKVISGKIAKSVFSDMWDKGLSAGELVKEKNLTQIVDESALEKIILEVLASNSAQVGEYKAGKTKVLGFFVGAVMKATKGQANPDIVNKIILEKLKGS
ncbi:MAG: Asp-tRNA(Asn)/Glu-tRNA(Gln) amidotransferase subunit GatB [Bdellovibrionales bacterium]